MTALTYTHVRNNLASVMDQAEADRNPILITRNGHSPVVMLSADEFDSMSETLYLISTTANRARLEKSLKDFAEGNTVEGELVDP